MSVHDAYPAGFDGTVPDDEDGSYDESGVFVTVPGPEVGPEQAAGGVYVGPYGTGEADSGAGTDAPGPAAYGRVSAVGGRRRYGRIVVFFSNPSLAVAQSGGGLARASLAGMWQGGTDETPDGLEAVIAVVRYWDGFDPATQIYLETPEDGWEGLPGDPATVSVVRWGAVDYITVESRETPRVE